MGVLLLYSLLLTPAGAQTSECAQALAKYRGLPVSVFMPTKRMIEIRDNIRKEDGTAGITEAESPLRKHGWDIFEAINTPIPGVCSEPLWRTWYTDLEALRPNGCEERAPGMRAYLKLQQSSMIQQQVLKAHEDARGPVFRNVLFSKEVCDGILARKVLDPLRLKEWRATGVRDIPELPSRSATVKTDWRVVKPNQALRLGVWRKEFGFGNMGEPPRRVQARQLAESDWEACVHVTQTAETPVPDYCGKVNGADIRGERFLVQDFYHVRVLNEEQLQAMKALVPQGRLEVNDVLILVGFHLTTREIPDWFWATFWWKPRTLQEGTESGGRPTSLENHRAWKNYVMDVTVSLKSPSDPMDGKSKVIYNPYLEATFLPFGTASNCMGCHMRAASCSGSNDPRTVHVDADGERYSEPVQYFEGKIRTDFLWSLEKVISKQTCSEH
ncbi:MAG: hypothetical protein U0R19_21575 [Bryobacteraceae bacterium]